MATNRIFICHAILKENQRDLRILQYLTEVLQRTGIELITNTNNDSEASLFQQLQQDLPTCQTFILLQTTDALYAPQVHLTVRSVQELATQKAIQIFRLVGSPEGEGIIPPEWQVMTTFDATSDYQRACEKLLVSMSANPITDLVQNANSAFVGRLDPTTNTRQGGVTWIHDTMPQLARLNVTAYTNQ